MRKLFLSIVAAALAILSSSVFAYWDNFTTISESFESSFPGSYFFQSKLNSGCSTTFNQWTRDYHPGLPWGGHYFADHIGGSYSPDPDNVDYILSTGTQDNPYGYYQFNFYVNADITTDLPHVLGITNWQEVSDTCSGAAHVHDVNKVQLYGVAAGGFGDGSKGWTNKRGFVVERRLADGSNSCVDLFPATFIDYGTSSGTFVGGWYRMKISRTSTTYSYQVWRWNESTWVSLGSKSISLSALAVTGNCDGSHQPSMDTSVLDPGRIGFGSYWAGSYNILLDDIVQNWAH